MVSAEKPEAWRPLYPFASHYADIGGHRLHYLDEGTGAPVVLLHGNPTWSFYYRDLTLALCGSRRVVVPDHMGCGLSDKPQDYPYRLATHIDNLETLLNRELQLPRLSLVVHDWGGAIGFGYACRHPERVERIVVLNSAAFLLARCPLRIRLCRTPVLGALLVRGGNAFARGALAMATTDRRRFTGPVRAGYLAPYDSYAHRIATLRFVQDIPLRPTHPSWKTVAAIQAQLGLLRHTPMMICWGDRDFCFTGEFLRVWQAHFPDARVHRFPAAGHYVLEDAGESIIPLATEFLTGTAAQREARTPDEGARD